MKFAAGGRGVVEITNRRKNISYLLLPPSFNLRRVILSDSCLYRPPTTGSYLSLRSSSLNACFF